MKARAMRKLEFLILKRDIVAVLERLGKEGCFQPSEHDRGGAGRPEAAGQNTAAAVLSGVDAALDYLGIEASDGVSVETALLGAAGKDAARALAAAAAALEAREAEAAAARAKAIEDAARLADFSGLCAPLQDIAPSDYLSLRVGRFVASDAAEPVLGGGAVMIKLGSRRVAACARGMEGAMDDELAKAGFIREEIPPGVEGVPARIIEEARAAAAAMEARLAAIAEEREAMVVGSGAALIKARESLLMEARIDELKAGLLASGRAYAIRGWVPADLARGLVEGLAGLTEGRLSAKLFDPDELEEVRNGDEKVPVSLRHGRFVASFERMVLSYGVPPYGTIDPTPVVALLFVLLFATMFGDMGQGLVVFLLGLAAGRAKKGPIARVAGFAPIAKAAGMASMATGFLYGSVFADETLLIPVERWVTGLFGAPADRIVQVLPTEGTGRMLAFLGFSVGIGIVVNSLGMILNVVNLLRRKRYAEALFSRTGLAGALLYWWAVSLAARTLLGGTLGAWDLAALALPLAAILSGERVWRRARGGGSGSGGLVIELFVETLEALSYHFSGTVSFLRVGAFALAHAVLSSVIMEMAGLLRAGSALGPAFSLLVFAAGNAIIIGLEGLIVCVQAVRLQYYEFFSKFFTETGAAFRPFRFAGQGSER